MDEYGDALDYDLLTTVGVRLRDVPSTIGWDGCALICRNLPIESALNRAREPELTAFGSSIKQSAILTDLFDNMSLIRYILECVYSKEKPKQPPLYPTPWTNNKSGNNQNQKTYGSGGVSVEDFDRIYYGLEDSDSDDEPSIQEVN